MVEDNKTTSTVKPDVKVDEKTQDIDSKESNDKKPDVKVDDILIKDKTKTFSADEVNKFITDAHKTGSKVIKDQLYPEIERLKNKVKESNKTLDTLKAKVDAAKESGDTDGAVIAENELQKALTLITQQDEKIKKLEDVAFDAINQVKDLSTTLSAKEIEAEKLKVIAEAKGNIIKEMVTGSTIEEIRESAIKAKEKYVEIQQQTENRIRQNLNLPSVEDEEAKKKETTGEEAVVVKRREFKSRRDFTEYKGTRDDIFRKVYAEAGFKLE